jgi:hypothetical protein
MSTRSLFAAAAAAWFAYNAFFFLPTGETYPNPGMIGGIDGDAGAVAVTWAARGLFAGLALLSLALIEWGKIVDFWRDDAIKKETDQDG